MLTDFAKQTFSSLETGERSFRSKYINTFNSFFIHTSYLSFFLHEQNFWRKKFTPKKRVNYGKIHSKLPIFCVITAKYTVNCQIFALNLKKFTLAKKNLHEYIRGVRDKYEVCFLLISTCLQCLWWVCPIKHRYLSNWCKIFV